MFYAHNVIIINMIKMRDHKYYIRLFTNIENRCKSSLIAFHAFDISQDCS